MCRPRLVRWLAGAFALLVPVSSAPCADDGTQQAEELLRANKVEPDNVGLAAFFRKRTLSDADQQKIQSLVRQLGDRSFARRNKASQALVEWGPSALRALQEALSDKDREISRRAAECITEINRGPVPPSPWLPSRCWRSASRRERSGCWSGTSRSPTTRLSRTRCWQHCWNWGQPAVRLIRRWQTPCAIHFPSEVRLLATSWAGTPSARSANAPRNFSRTR